jgi:hypothetical protein
MLAPGVCGSVYTGISGANLAAAATTTDSATALPEGAVRESSDAPDPRALPWQCARSGVPVGPGLSGGARWSTQADVRYCAVLGRGSRLWPRPS